MPLLANVTMTFALVALDSVAVTDKSAPFSATDAELPPETVSVTFGRSLVSLIVIVWDCVPLSVAEPPLTVSIAIIAVSSPS